MKKLSEGFSDWLLRRNAALMRRRVRQAGLTKSFELGHIQRRKHRWKTAVIRVPEQLVAEQPEAREQLNEVVRSVIKALARPNTNVRLDFTRTNRLYPGGTLILLAYLELLIQIHPGRIRARCRPKSLAAQLLRHFGIADELGIDVADSIPTDESVVNWRYLTGTGAEGEKIGRLMDSYREITSVDPPEGLYDVLNEALVNVRHHAYPAGTRIPDDLRRWWLFARFSEPKDGKPGNLYIAVYDIGVGIQNSLKAKLQLDEQAQDLADEVLETLRLGRTKRLETMLLLRAVEHQRSSTGLAFRGHGLPEMRRFVLQTTSGRLYIISGAAQYVCAPALKMGDCISCKQAFPGTLILWSIPLGRKELAS